ncbi:zinc finger MYM-type protein 6-like, partial [Aphis craccivora]
LNRCASKLTVAHIYPGPFQKMRVCYATQVFSATVAAGMRNCIMNGTLSSAANTTVNFIDDMDKLFDLLNLKPKDVVETKIIEHMKFLNGWQITINSLLQLWEDVQTPQYVLFTYRLKDCLENLFGNFRNQNGNNHSEGSNCLEYLDEILTNLGDTTSPLSNAVLFLEKSPFNYITIYRQYCNLKSFNFIFALTVLKPILIQIRIVSTKLQSPDLDLLAAVSIVEALKKSLTDLRTDEDNYSTLFDKVLDMFLDDLLNGLEERFSQETLLLISAIGRLLQFNMHEHDLTLFSNRFNLNDSELETELRLLKSLPEFEIGKTSKTIYQWLNNLSNNNLCNSFQNIYIILTHFVTMPVTSCSCERSFSKLSLVKTKLRSCMTQDRLESMMLVFVEQKLASELDLEDIIEKFKHLNNTQRRLEL